MASAQLAVANGHWCGGKRPPCGASAASLSQPFKADWHDERWDEIRRIAAAAEKPYALVVNHKTVFAHIRHCIRWVAAASSLIFVLAVLLIFIPESRAFAIQMYHSIIQLFDSRVEIKRPTQAHVWGEYDSQMRMTLPPSWRKSTPRSRKCKCLPACRSLKKQPDIYRIV